MAVEAVRRRHQAGFEGGAVRVGRRELFGGYPSFRQIPTILKWGRRIPVPRPLGRLIESVRRVGIPGVTPKAADVLSHSRSMAEVYLLRRGLRLQGELDALLDESWLKAGLEQLAPAATIRRTLAPLQAARYRLVQHGSRIGGARSIRRRDFA